MQTKVPPSPTPPLPPSPYHQHVQGKKGPGIRHRPRSHLSKGYSLSNEATQASEERADQVQTHQAHPVSSSPSSLSLIHI